MVEGAVACYGVAVVLGVVIMEEGMVIHQEAEDVAYCIVLRWLFMF